jgi:hypothetical protein
VHDLLRLYDERVRATTLDRLPAGWTGERDGPLARCVLPHGTGFAMLVDDAGGLSEDELAALVDRTVGFFSGRNLAFEWKTYDHDRADLPALLLSRGAVAQPHEALVLGETAALAGPVVVPPGLTLREASESADFAAISALKTAVWNEEWAWLAPELESRAAAGEIRVFVVTDGPLVVSAAWLEPEPGTGVAGLWGGSTLAQYRGRGCYRALLAVRANLAQELGYEVLQVDASDDSRPILTRLGLHVVGGTTPYQFGEQ